MADEDKAPEQAASTSQAPAEAASEPPSSQASPPPTVEAPQPSSVSPAPEDRSVLLQRARAFLSSPQVRHEDLVAKRRFLTEKGLTNDEVEGLLREVPPPPPPLPPRTYPQPPPSRLPHLLLNVLRAFTWIAGGSAALLLVYFRFIYPKIAQTYQARLSLRTHRKALLERLTNSLDDLKAAQRSTFAVLPQPGPFHEPAKYRSCRTLAQLAEASAGEKNIAPITLLRCAIQECAKGTHKKATSAELFRMLEETFPWVAEGGADSELEETLWKTLTTTPIFQPAPLPPSPPGSPAPPQPAPSSATVPPALLTSLSSLSAALPAPAPAPPQPKFQHTFQALSDLTGYITTQTYAAPLGLRAPGVGLNVALPPEAEEVRREIRALKGLVLNRRSFMPRMPSTTTFARPVEAGAA
ncbi:hypothetical protein C8Q78DRAFT_1002404 [Trametes maxima]|nr:hypothetical protein C8Q78DRAFT_1002404 [Trametes maxima]